MIPITHSVLRKMELDISLTRLTCGSITLAIGQPFSRTASLNFKLLTALE